jgi:hypothetical protein
MTGVSVLLAEVQAVGVQLGLDGGKLRIRAPRDVLTATQRAQLVEHRAEIIRLLAEPVDYGSDEVVADLKTVFTVDGPASHAAAERLAKARGVDGPAGDDLPAWQSWMNRRYTVWRTRGFSQADAKRIVWGEAENAWHKRHGAPSEPDRCAGCGRKILAGDGMPQIDGAVVHIGDPDHVECLAIHGAQWRSAASVGLMALGLMRTRS